MIFNEDKLQAEIIKTWGEFGVHNEVFQAMRKKISDKEQLNLTDVVKPSLCELYDFGRQNKACEKKCNSCKWMEEQ